MKSSEYTLESPRTTVKRMPKRGAYDRATIEAILDEGLVCHLGFAVEGQPYVLPTIYARVGDEVYLHGSAASRMLGTLGDGVALCLTVTLLDGLVLARSAFHHSVNYRSVVLLGTARAVIEPEAKTRALHAIVDHVLADRWQAVRPPTEQEMKATTVLALPLSEASAKLRSGGPLDDEEDYELPVWAGHLPLTLVPGAPVPDARLVGGVAVPAGLAGYRRPQRNGGR
ncbi:MAG: pyridoxamine 5'-phosphate oxidase family protein [Candidatus Binatia bacterium]|jgi:nitroimidazol reductase NimA-like FMN-containing flavoprotein (pyridoxamine 5'-phosphate oxidase superfamily)